MARENWYARCYLWRLMTMKLSTVLVAVAVAGGCVEAPTLGDEVLDLGPGSGTNEQGRFYLGGIADDLAGPLATYHVSVNPTVVIGAASTTLSVLAGSTSGTCLSATVGATTYTCADPAFNGLVLNGPGGSRPRLRVVASSTFPIVGDGGHLATGYLLQHNANWPSTVAPLWQSYCVGDRVAYPLAGSVERATGGFAPATGAITFACTEYAVAGAKPAALPNLTGNGVVGKAMSWGYLPGSDGYDGGGRLIKGAFLHEGAVSAGRAAYCGDGQTHTLDVTSIRIFDLVNGNVAYGDLTTHAMPIEPTPISAAPIDSSSYSFESVWKPVGAGDPGGQLTYTWHPFCFSRLRWQSLPLGNRCGGTVAVVDPRGQESTKFCEDYTLPELAAAGGLVGIYSQWNDLGLWRWKHNTNGDYYSTTVGAYGGSQSGIVPAAGYELAAPELQGTVMTVNGRPIFEANYGLDGGTLVEIRSCRVNGTTDWVTAGTTWLQNHGYTVSSCKVEGHVWATPPTADVLTELGWTMRELKLWKKGAEYATSVTAPTGYINQVASVGWIVGPATW